MYYVFIPQKALRQPSLTKSLLSMSANDEINALKGQTIGQHASDIKQRSREISSLGKAIAHASRQLERGKHSPKTRYDRDNDEE